jgi:hypothetical protein
MRKTLFLAVLFMIFVACSQSSLSTEWYDWLYGGELSGNHGNPVTNWYEISQWEVAVCFDWGGTRAASETSSTNIDADYYHNLVATLQAEISSPLDDTSVSAGKNVYEVAWFIQPSDTDESINFEVYIFSSGLGEVIGSSSANYVNGFRDYYVIESEKNYTKAVMKYWNDEREGELEVPFVR